MTSPGPPPPVAFPALVACWTRVVGRGSTTPSTRYRSSAAGTDPSVHDAEFRLIRMSRLPNIGVDHFPILFSLALNGCPGGEFHTRAKRCRRTAAGCGKWRTKEAREGTREAIGTTGKVNPVRPDLWAHSAWRAHLNKSIVVSRIYHCAI